ncbi:TonB-dependent receptor domain-containing protein [Rheinheimera sp. 4Y26]|uniref:TonB-dependent receptor domain-containing protein n=1 Tax=Rheinheimera sp. 4Y26 TaxID=2977811 RepID=UPI0021B0F3D3|nr:TonB-dependent receptor [Rheinheimera sp. 4Y26]MCT6698678.1 TonB-dependent receptor [Rheinheimera sp. 4Y26]
MSSKHSFQYSRVNLGVLLALATSAAVVLMPASATETTQAEAAPVALQPLAEQVERINVSGRLLSSAAATAEERRQQPYVAELLGMEQISRAGDSNAASALRRVTGLTLVKDKFIYVRGLGERYSSTLLNGAQVPSPDPTRNVVPLDMFPAGIIESMVVQKAYSPELPAAFGGGNVNIRTVSIPREEIFSFSIGTGYNSLSSDDGLDYAGGSDDWRGKDDGTRSLSAGLKQALDQYGSLDVVKIAQGLGGVTPQNLAKAEAINRSLGLELNRDMTFRQKSIGPEYDGSLSYGNRFDIGQSVFGLMAGISYDKSAENFKEQERYYSISSGSNLTPLNRYDDIRGTEHQVKMSGMLNFGLEWDENHRFETSSIYLADTKDELKVKIGDSIETINEQNRENEDYSVLYEERTMLTNQVRGRHTLTFLNDLAFDWQYTDAKAERDAPNEVEYRYVRQLANDGTLQNRTMRRSDNAAIYQFGSLEDNTENASWNAKYPMTLGDTELTLSTGYAYFERQRNASTNRFKMDTRGFSNEALSQSYHEIFSDANINDPAKKFLLSDVTAQADDYVAAQQTDAAYVGMEATYDMTWRVNAGVRYEDFRQVSIPLNPATGAIEGNLTDFPRQEDDLYPSLAVTWMQSEENQYRFGFSETVVRPDLREVTPVLFIDPITDFKVIGFSGLKSTSISAYDLRWEQYLDSGSNYSLGVFYKDLTNPIEAVELKGSDGNLLMSFRNALGGEVYGVEAEALQKLDMFEGSFGELMDNFFVVSNFTYSESEIEIESLGETNLTNLKRPLTGHSKYVVNMQLGFDSDNEAHTATLTYNVFGKRIAFAGIDGKDDAYEQPFHSLDFVYSYNVLPEGTIKVSAKNLLNKDVEILQQGEILQRREQGRSVGLSYSQRF